MKIAIPFLLLALAGCSQDSAKSAAAMQLFIDGCARPVSGTLNISTYSADVKLHCAEFKPMTKAAK